MNRASIAVLFGLGCSGDSIQTVTEGSDQQQQEQDEDPPVIEHEPITSSQTFMQDVDMTAIVTDDISGVFVVEVIYKRVDSTVWYKKPLMLEDPETGEFGGAIPASDVQSSGMDYYLHALDKEGNESFDPEDGESDAYHFRIDGDVDTGR